jgi:hypothetical protein
MNGESIFSRRLLIGWIIAAVLTFIVSLYFMGNKDQGDTVGPSAFSRSAIGYAGIADVLQRLGTDVVKSRYDSLGKLTSGSVMVIAEPRPSPATERTVRTLLKADTILLVLPKWTGAPSRRKSSWLGEAALLSSADAAWVLHFVAPRADVVRTDEAFWTTNTLAVTPTLQAPIQLIHGSRLRPIIGDKDGILLGEVSPGDGQFLLLSDPLKPLQRGAAVTHKRTVWVLSDPDVISNHGFAEGDNAALAVAMFKHLLAGSGRVVFDETLHGFTSEPAGPLLLLFRFPFIVATIQGAIALALLLWATLGRFGAPQPAPPPISAGRLGLLQNIAKLVEFTGHHEVMIRRYVFETVRDVARQLHAPRGLSTPALVSWLQRVGAARGITTDCGTLMSETEALADGRRRSAASLVRLARDIHRWRGEIVDGRARHPRDR